jgi:hypothetical protein
MQWCRWCKIPVASAYVHLYECPVLHGRITEIHPKKGTRRNQPLHSLTHEGGKGVGRPELCNCEICIRLDEEEE